ncbi:MAG TPA: hypothetical protein VIC06_03095 [Solirubrobacteraceae bacterium]
MGVVGVGFLLYGLLRLSEPFELWWKAHRTARIDYARYAAIRDIRDIRRRAIHDLLAAERQYRDIGGDSVIDGTCSEIEVGR